MGFLGFAMCLALQRQFVPDDDIDAVVQRMAKDTSEIGVLRSLAWQNMPRVVWNYKRANGAVRSRILDAVHMNGGYSDLLPLAAREKSEDLRVMAASSLGRANYGKDVPKRNAALIPMWRDPSPKVRATVAKGLRWSAPEAKTKLVAMMKDSNPWVRYQAALSLAYEKDERCLPVLTQFVGVNQREKPPIWIGGEDNAEMAISRFNEKAVPFVLPLLKSSNSQTKFEAMHILIRAKAPNLIELGKGLLRDKDAIVRIAGYRAIGSERKRESIPILLQGLEDHGHNPANNVFVDSNVEYILNGGFRTGAEQQGWPEGVQALKDWKAAHKKS